MADNPLLEALPDSLDELFCRDPMGLADIDIERIVTKLRADRVKWKQDEAAGKTKATKAKPAKGPDPTLEDLLG